MKFFIPNADDEAQAERVYEGLREHASKLSGGAISQQRYFSIKWLNDGKLCHAEVGKQETLTGTTVVAIFDAGQLFYVYTYARGVLDGSPMLAGFVKDYERFER